MMMNTNIKINYSFKDMTDHLENDMKELIDKNIEGKMSNYFQKFLTKEDAEIKINVRMVKNADEKYEGSFDFVMDGDEFVYHNDKPFSIPDDVVNHAFDHLKRYLSDKK